jgi:hypothetical protein
VSRDSILYEQKTYHIPLSSSATAASCCLISSATCGVISGASLDPPHPEREPSIGNNNTQVERLRIIVDFILQSPFINNFTIIADAQMHPSRRIYAEAKEANGTIEKRGIETTGV